MYLSWHILTTNQSSWMNNCNTKHIMAASKGYRKYQDQNSNLVQKQHDVKWNLFQTMTVLYFMHTICHSTFRQKLNPFIFSATEKHLKPISRNFGDQNMLFCNFGNFTCFYVDPLAGPLWPMISCCVCYFKRTNNSPTYFLPQAFSKCYFSKEKASTLSVVN